MRLSSFSWFLSASSPSSRRPFFFTCNFIHISLLFNFEFIDDAAILKLWNAEVYAATQWSWTVSSWNGYCFSFALCTWLLLSCERILLYAWSSLMLVVYGCLNQSSLRDNIDKRSLTLITQLCIYLNSEILQNSHCCLQATNHTVKPSPRDFDFLQYQLYQKWVWNMFHYSWPFSSACTPPLKICTLKGGGCLGQ